MPSSFTPLMEIARIQSEINRLFDNLLDLPEDGIDQAGTWIPNADLLETEEAVLVFVELPGVSTADLTVSVHSGNIVIEGVKARAPESEESRQVSERSFGRFQRSVQLGVPVNTRQARAVLTAGLLKIRFPKVPNRRGEAVKIEVESA